MWTTIAPRKKTITPSAAATALTPAVALTLDMAHLAGYIHGILDRPAIRRAREEASGA